MPHLTLKKYRPNNRPINILPNLSTGDSIRKFFRKTEVEETVIEKTVMKKNY